MSLIGQMLVKNGIISEEQLDEALKAQKHKQKRLGEILVELGYISTENLIWMLSEQADIPFVDIKPEMLDSAVINKFPESMLYNNVILPLYETNDKVYLAMGDPTDKKAIEAIQNHVKKDVVVSGANPAKVEQLLNRFYLSHQIEARFEEVFSREKSIRITSDLASIEFTDESGQVTSYRGRAEIKMTLMENSEDRGTNE
jgi:hypothetical protein